MPISPPTSNRNYTFYFKAGGSQLLGNVREVPVTVRLLRCTMGRYMTVSLFGGAEWLWGKRRGFLCVCVRYDSEPAVFACRCRWARHMPALCWLAHKKCFCLCTSYLRNYTVILLCLSLSGQPLCQVCRARHLQSGAHNTVPAVSPRWNLHSRPVAACTWVLLALSLCASSAAVSTVGSMR